MFGFKKELYTPEYQLAGDECAVIETSKGTIKVKFDGEGAPIHVANFCELSTCLLYTSPSPRDRSLSRMPSSA